MTKTAAVVFQGVPGLPFVRCPLDGAHVDFASDAEIEAARQGAEAAGERGRALATGPKEEWDRLFD